MFDKLKNQWWSWMLSADDRELRKKACRELGKSGADSALEPLVRKLDDEYFAVRETACKALSLLQNPGAIPRLKPKLNDEHPFVRKAACYALVRLGVDDLTDKFIQMLEDEHPEVRAAACAALGVIGDISALEPLMKRLHDEQPDIRKAACTAIGSLKGAEASKTLLGLLGDQSSYVRRASCEALGYLGDQSAVGPLIYRLGDENRQVREAAAEALKQLGEGRMAVAVVNALKGDEAAYFELKQIVKEGDDRFIESLIPLLGDDDNDVRKGTVSVLEALGEGGLADAVYGTITGEKESQKELIKRAFDGDKRAVWPLIRALKIGHWKTRVTVCDTLGQIADPRSIGPLSELLKDDNWHVRGVACHALSNFKNPSCFEPIAGRLKDDNADIRKSACLSLGNLGDVRAAPLLVEKLDDENCSVRAAAAHGLGMLNVPDTLNDLLRHLPDADKELRLAICENLGEFRNENAVVPLIRHLGDNSEKIRKAAGSSLVKLGEDLLANSVLGAMEGDGPSMNTLRALVQRGDERPLEPLVSRLTDEDPEKRKKVTAVFLHLGEAGKNKLVRLLADEREEYRRIACKILSEMGEKELALAVVSALEADKNALPTLKKLSKNGDTRPIHLLMQRLVDKNYKVRKAAQDGLVYIGRPALNPLLRKLDSKNSLVRTAVSEALDAFGHVASIPLVNMLSDKRLGTRRNAARFLGLITKVTRHKMPGMLCKRHFTRFEIRRTPISENEEAHYAACRKSGRPEEALFGIKKVVSVIDEDMRKDWTATGEIIRVNQLKRQEVFDFDLVEIIKAGEKTVLQFCSLIGKDDDVQRNLKYPKMTCLLYPGCEITENTYRILGNIFGSVRIKRG